jgi:hypothetical protein
MRWVKIVFSLLAVAYAGEANAETWSARSVPLADQGPRCSGRNNKYTFDLVNNMLSVSSATGKHTTFAVPPDGMVKHVFRTVTVGNLEIAGNVKSRQLQLTNVSSGCRYQLVVES